MTTRPFLGTEALASGTVTRRTLASRHDTIYRNVCVPEGQELTAETRAVAAWLWSGRNATAAGLSAAALHGSNWIDAALPAELIRSVPCKVVGISIHRETLGDHEACVVRGIPATTAARTAYDLGRREGLTRAVIWVVALANATGIEPEDFIELIDPLALVALCNCGKWSASWMAVRNRRRRRERDCF